MKHASFIAAGAALVTLAAATCSQAAIRITEWMYAGGTSEFIEFTNTGASPIDMTDWSYDDDSRTAGIVSLSAFGVVQPGESVLLIENADTDAFRAAWGLAATVDIIGSNAANLGRNDEINVYDASSVLVDRLTYGDQTFAGTIRTQNTSGSTTLENLGLNTISAWSFSTVGDVNGSTSVSGDIASPGFYAVPEPASLALLGLGGLALIRRRRA